MKKVIAALLAVLMVLAMAGCAKDNDAEFALLQAQLAQLQAQLDGQSTSDVPEAPVQDDDVPADDYIYLYNAHVDGQDRIAFKGHKSVTAEAIIPEGMAVDCWLVGGEEMAGDEDDTVTFNASGTTAVQAKLRPEKTVITINAQMKFIDEHDKPKGEPFELFVFEEEFLNPVTNEWHEGGTITVYVEAVVPKGYVIDYWKINEIPYYYNKTVSAFTVVELDESTVYEVVLRKVDATPTPKPTAKPTAAPAATPSPEIEDPITEWEDTPAPVETPNDTPAPVYYNVSCSDCSYDGRTSGQVPAGTTITVKGNDGYGLFEVNDSVYAKDKSSITLTINADTYIHYIQKIN